ncbi:MULTISPECIES: GvpL/GvpF family gas vesicle protein [unclassified Rhodococcus (in: high G+C Gram-positive bacteria)]|uniref:GvpL/GvpF family gas vesicle protein n=1 Tax=unclassified Rhodococcus (in: high G+C Gram-positive bacteria) TaxID=192944 RepID=UPI00163A5E4F|nr:MULTISPECIES: GvpL/GvpF family gas vesicle protein [unclassified Rhodococcus (in: high G+C Gram-positive bacteria)]MBC2638223.1 GvpL/GvpF family gas vesicle protein [Rhodococcus sp. 3A]MBC2897034.1 GvpL/GvpF family gas vesicle protein [Rhodococcus sp. 4CII]
MATSEQTKQMTGVYVYGIVPADIEIAEEATGVADGTVDLVTQGEIAALVSELSVDRALGKPEDLRAHADLLDGTARVAPVLPLRFGAVLSDADAVKEELLSAHADEFASALDQLAGKAQYIVKGRYVEKAILREIIDESEEAAQLRDAIRDKSEDAGRDARMALGELVSNAIAAKRDQDTQTTVEALDDLVESVNMREPTHEEEAVQVAVLADVERQEELEEVVGQLAENWEGRVEIKLLGPQAAYDFVVTQKPEG